MSNFRRLAAQLIDFPETQTINYKAMKKLSVDDNTFSDKIIYHTFNRKTKEGIIVLKNNIIKINNNVFKNNRFLLSIDIPTTVTEIGSGVFEGCVNLHTVNIKNIISTINDNTFKNCTSLKYINIDNVLDSVGISAFENCKSLTDIVFSESVTFIGNSCFKNCINLNNVVLPKNITELPEYCFYDCESLEFIDIPEGVTILNKYVFNKVDGINANIPNTLNKIIINGISYSAYNEIEYWYFNDLYIKDIDSYFNISWAYSGNSAKAIGIGKCKNLYVNDELLTKYTFPDTVSEIKDCLFIGCQCIEEITFPNNNFIINSGAFSNCKNLSILNNFDKCTYAYSGVFCCCNLNTIDLSNLTEIHDGFIAGNKNITTLVIPDAIDTIPYHAFHKCVNLQHITLSNNITKICGSAFMECINLQEISLPENITVIESYTFYNCKSLQEIYIPEDVTGIEEWAFYGCKNLKTINTENIVRIGRKAFDYCESLETLNISKDCIIVDSYIDNKASPFVGCNNLNIILDEENSNFSIVDGFLCTKDGSEIICYAEPIEECIIPNNITKIRDGAFQNRDISSIKFGDNIKKIPHSLCKNCENLTNIDFNNVTTISTSSFEGCTSLVNVNFNNVSDITENAFANCTSLEEVTFLKSVYMHTNGAAGYRHINVFKDCVNLKYVNFSNEQTTLYLDIFENCTSFTDLYISKNIKDISGSIRGSNIKNVHIESLDDWLNIDNYNSPPLIKNEGFYNPLVYAENLYINGELVTDVVINKNIGESFLGYKKLNSITIKNNYYATGLAFPNNPNIIIENPSEGVGMIFDENNLLWYGHRVNYGSTSGGLSSGNTIIGNIVDFRNSLGRGDRYINSYSFLNNNTVEYVYLGRARIVSYAFFGSTKIKAFFIDDDARQHGYGSSNHLRLDDECFGEIRSDYKIAIKDNLYDYWYDILESVNIPNIEDRVITQTEWDYFQELEFNQSKEEVVLKQNMYMLKKQINNVSDDMNETLIQRLMNMYNQLMQKMKESNSNNQQQTTNNN